MVLYFSGTGNTEYIAKMIAEGLGDECVDLFDRIRTNDTSPLYSEKTYVICAPIYVCALPIFLMKYLKSIEFQEIIKYTLLLPVEVIVVVQRFKENSLQGRKI